MSLIGKILSKWPLLISVVHNALTTARKLNHDFKIVALEFNLFQIQFATLAGKCKVLMEGPWYFDKSLIIFREIPSGACIENMEMKFVPFWVLIYNMPINWHHKVSFKRVVLTSGRRLGIDFVHYPFFLLRENRRTRREYQKTSKMA